MKFRRKLLLAFAVVVCVCVVAVAWIISALAKRNFERNDEQRTSALVTQFRREFDRRGDSVVRQIDAVAKSDVAIRIANSLGQGTPDYAAYLNDAKLAAENERLDFLEFVDGDGSIISSAQSPAKFGYKEPFPVTTAPGGAFLKQEEMPDAQVLGLMAVRRAGDLYVMGGRKLDKEFLASLDPPAGMRVFFYQNVNSSFSPQFVISSSGPVESAESLAPLIERVQQQGKEGVALVHWSANAGEDEIVDAIPLNGADHHVLGILLIASSRGPYVDLQQHIRSAAFISAAAGMMLAVLLSGWVASRITRPVEQLARAAQEVAAGNWKPELPARSGDEVGQLAQSFNQMTRELLDQRDRLVQAERVAAWREVARRLAHELKNPLFPLQLTVENLVRARQQSPEQFEEIFHESSTTLLAEIANLKAIVSRFSEFSRMPQPQFQTAQLNELVTDLARFFQPQFTMAGRPPIECRLDLASALETIAADPELLHRALSNLVLNAIDAMPNGGTLTLRTKQAVSGAVLEISDTGAGLKPEERDRLFTPYYTTKPQGTGLGLVIVQSIISNHAGKVTVQSKVGEGTTFVIELPANADKIAVAGATANSGRS